VVFEIRGRGDIITLEVIVDKPTLQEVEARNPFSETTRRHRRTRLALALLCIAIPVLKIQPTDLTVLGFTLKEPNLGALYTGLVVVTAYFLAVFWHNAHANMMTWEMDIGKAQTEPDYLEQLKSRNENHEGDDLEVAWKSVQMDEVYGDILKSTPITYQPRRLLEFYLPVAVGLAGIRFMVAMAIKHS